MNRIFAPLLAAGLALAPMTFTSVAHAQTKSSVSEAQDMLAWQQQYTQAILGLLEIVDAELMTEMYDVIDSEDAQRIETFGKRYASLRTATLARGKRQIDALPAPERWNINPGLFNAQERALYDVAKLQYDDANTMLAEFETLTGTMVEMLSNVETTSQERINALVDVQTASGLRMIEMENRQLDGFLRSIPETSPNHSLQKIFKASNLFSMEEAKLNRDYIEDEDDISIRQGFGRAMERALSDIPRLIAKGRRDYTSTRGNLQDILDSGQGTAQERAFLSKAIVAMGSFLDSFEVEEQLYENMMSTSRLLRSSRSDLDITADRSAIDLAYFELSERQADLIMTRMAAMQ